MNFKEFRNALQKHCGEMMVGVTNLFRVEVDKEELWNLYLDSFPSNTNSLYRKRREFDCSCCRNFVKEFGSVVTIMNGVVTSIWDLTLGDDKYQVVVDAMSEFIHSKPIAGLYLSRSERIGTKHNFELDENGTEFR